MLADDVIERLTAYVDGALAPRQHEAVTRLLLRSPEARALVRQLMEDARRLRQLPTHAVEPSLVPEVLADLAPAALPRPRRARRGRRWQPYTAATVAACLLLAVAGIYFTAFRFERTPAVAVTSPRKVEPPFPAVTPAAPPPHATHPLIAQVIDGVYSQFGAPIPPEHHFSLTFGELRGNGRAHGQLAYELAKDRAVHLDVVVRDRTLALDRLRGVFYESGIDIVLDPATSQSLQKKADIGEFYVYAENIRPEELARMLGELSKDDNKLQQFKKTPFERVTVQALPLAEQQRVSSRLGIAPVSLDPRTLPPLPPTNAATRWNRSAVVLPGPATGHASREVQAFVRERHRPRPGAVQVLVKIRVEK